MPDPASAKDIFSDINFDTEDSDDPKALRVHIEELLGRLEAAISPTTLERLHPIEQMMVRDFQVENRHLNCRGCVRLLERLIAKLTTP